MSYILCVTVVLFQASSYTLTADPPLMWSGAAATKTSPRLEAVTLNLDPWTFHLHTEHPSTSSVYHHLVKLHSCNGYELVAYFKCDMCPVSPAVCCSAGYQIVFLLKTRAPSVPVWSRQACLSVRQLSHLYMCLELPWGWSEEAPPAVVGEDVWLTGSLCLWFRSMGRWGSHGGCGWRIPSTITSTTPSTSSFRRNRSVLGHLSF